MTSPLLIKGNRSGRDITAVTPESAGWKFVGFRAVRLKPAEVERFSTEAREYCLVVLSGKIDLRLSGGLVFNSHFKSLGNRQSVFDAVSPAAVYIPAATEVTISAISDCEIALCHAPSDQQIRPPVLIDSVAMKRSQRGQGSNLRFVCDILPQDHPAAASLLVVEVVTPPGHSSSYPPHKHDVDNYPSETRLEETYYHRLNPAGGFAFQRVYSDDRSLDEAMAVEDHDVVLVPRGYHPCVAPHGYELYYLNVMAGPRRHWAFTNDPAHQWLIKT
ncbi:MAG: 5-deoxy-glucuronate isomerase [Candidatus Pacebacteria bacterium]|nr:5-deoxy-glucuronate isomerase [Candidatus Paceibacterota bacterium]